MYKQIMQMFSRETIKCKMYHIELQPTYTIQRTDIHHTKNLTATVKTFTMLLLLRISSR